MKTFAHETLTVLKMMGFAQDLSGSQTYQCIFMGYLQKLNFISRITMTSLKPIPSQQNFGPDQIESICR